MMKNGDVIEKVTAMSCGEVTVAVLGVSFQGLVEEGYG
jgi:hypothetical protein